MSSSTRSAGRRRSQRRRGSRGAAVSTFAGRGSTGAGVSAAAPEAPAGAQRAPGVGRGSTGAGCRQRFPPQTVMGDPGRETARMGPSRYRIGLRVHVLPPMEPAIRHSGPRAKHPPIRAGPDGRRTGAARRGEGPGAGVGPGQRPGPGPGTVPRVRRPDARAGRQPSPTASGTCGRRWRSRPRASRAGRARTRTAARTPRHRP